jgi:hypothetical protein
MPRHSALGSSIGIKARGGGLELPEVEPVYHYVTDFDSVRKGMENHPRVTHLVAIVAQNIPETE